MILDAAFGEPKWLWDRIPHPAVLMGRAVGYADEKLNKDQNKRIKGIISVATLSFGAIILGLILTAIPSSVIDVIVDAVPIVMQCPGDAAMWSSSSHHASQPSRPAPRSAQYFHTSLPLPS